MEGLDAFRETVRNSKPPIDYDRYPVSGLTAPDDRTLVIKLTRPYRQLLYVLTMMATKVVAREAVEFYGEEFLNHPVGTGPFVLKEWVRGQKLVFDRYPNYWGETYPSEGSEEDRKAGMLADAGKTLPFADRLTLWIYVESQPAWLNFLKGNLDLGGIPKEAFDTVYDKDHKVRPEIKSRGIQAAQVEEADVILFVFNLEHPVLGRNKALRQAISAAIDRKELIDLLYNGRAVPAAGPIPPGLFGHDPELKDPNGYDLVRAERLMKEARRRNKELTGREEIPPIVYDIASSTTSRQMGELVAHQLARIGVKLEIRAGTWPQMSDRMAKGQTQFFSYAWVADYPDAENFLQLLYGRNVAPGPNYANFRNKRYDELHEKMRDLPDTPERQTIISEMVKILHEEVPWALFAHRTGHQVRQPWVKNYSRNPFGLGNYKYVNIDPELKAKSRSVTP